MVLAGFLKKDLDRKLNERSAKRLRKRLDKARKEGRVEERAKHEEEPTASTEWLARMQEAQRKGDPFDEEPPWEANGASES